MVSASVEVHATAWPGLRIVSFARRYRNHDRED